MSRPRFTSPFVFLTCFCIAIALASCSHAPTATGAYEPTVGQTGKDVVWVPTAQALVDRMLDMAKVTPQDYVIDLGSGDGRTVITAAKRGARALGIEYNPEMVALSKRNAEMAGVAGKARFVHGDIFQSDFTQATVITLFLLPQLNLKLRPQILAMKPGTRVASNSFDMADWTPDETFEVQDREKCTSFCTAYLWIVPAKVAGTWKLAQGELTLDQEFQMVKGTLNANGRRIEAKGKMVGDRITLTAGDATYSGRVTGNNIEGIVASGGKTASWTAIRTGETRAK